MSNTTAMKLAVMVYATIVSAEKTKSEIEKHMKMDVDHHGGAHSHARVLGSEEGPEIESMFGQLYGSVSDYFGMPASSTLQVEEIGHSPMGSSTLQVDEVQDNKAPIGSSTFEVEEIPNIPVSDNMKNPTTSVGEIHKVEHVPAEGESGLASHFQSFKPAQNPLGGASSFLEVGAEMTGVTLSDGFTAVEKVTVNPEPYTNSMWEPGASDLGIVHAFGGDPIASTLRLLKAPVEAVAGYISDFNKKEH